ncbi:hypothetical protein FHU30_004969 [Actinomadura rupiterrae]|nr:hypothetical protein [Actinomadura rupiterrae]
MHAHPAPRTKPALATHGRPGPHTDAPPATQGSPSCLRGRALVPCVDAPPGAARRHAQCRRLNALSRRAWTRPRAVRGRAAAPCPKPVPHARRRPAPRANARRATHRRARCCAWTRPRAVHGRAAASRAEARPRRAPTRRASLPEHTLAPCMVAPCRAWTHPLTGRWATRPRAVHRKPSLLEAPGAMYRPPRAVRGRALSPCVDAPAECGRAPGPCVDAHPAPCAEARARRAPTRRAPCPNALSRRAHARPRAVRGRGRAMPRASPRTHGGAVRRCAPCRAWMRRRRCTGASSRPRTEAPATRRCPLALRGRALAPHLNALRAALERALHRAVRGRAAASRAEARSCCMRTPRAMQRRAPCCAWARSRPAFESVPAVHGRASGHPWTRIPSAAKPGPACTEVPRVTHRRAWCCAWTRPRAVRGRGRGSCVDARARRVPRAVPGVHLRGPGPCAVVAASRARACTARWVAVGCGVRCRCGR